MNVINELEPYFKKLNIEFQEMSVAKIAKSEIIIDHYQSQFLK